MYGFVNSALEKLIQRRFGEEIWQEVRAKAAVLNGIGEEERGTFMTHFIYGDHITSALVAAAVDILGINADTILEMFGEQFLLWCEESGYEKTLQLLGRSLMDFLENLDALHDHLAVIYPQMKAPSFRCVEGDDGLHLHYYSERSGLSVIVQGIVKSVARELYDTEVRVERIKLEQTGGQNHAEFLVTKFADESCSTDGIPIPVPPRFLRRRPSAPVAPLVEKPPIVSEQAFCKAFPFHIIFDQHMVILQMGNRLKKLIAPTASKELKVTSFFSLQRPRLEFTFQNILNHINTIYIMLAKLNRSSVAVEETIRLRGQMIYLSDSNCMLYVCSPHFRTLQDLGDKGLYISDIPIHDASRSLIITGGALESEHKLTLQMAHLAEQKEELAHKLQQHKEKMKNLLLEIMPFPVARALLSGKAVDAKEFQCVTVLFSDIVGFTRICQQCSPGQVVNMLNELYCYFDQVLPRNNVYKVETIGDAYMVVGGLPEPNTTHAADVCNQALDMLMCSKMVKDPTDMSKNVEIRIGIHSGEVAAGVVGIKMPRYCLFGDTVNVASRTEANSIKGRINVTEWTYVHLKDNPNWVFEVRGPVDFKNVSKPVMCYWLIENVERSMQEKPTLEDPSEVSLFAELISSPKERQDSLIVDRDDNDSNVYFDPLVKDDYESLGRVRYDSMVPGPYSYAPHSPLASRHVSHELLMSSLHSFQARTAFEERQTRSYSVADMSQTMPPLRARWPETIHEEEPQHTVLSTYDRSHSFSTGGYLNITHVEHKISTESNSSDSELTVTPRKNSSSTSHTSEMSVDSGYDAHEPEVAPVAHSLRRTGLDAAMPDSWVRQTKEKFERMTSERKKRESEMEAFQHTKAMRSRSMCHNRSSDTSLGTSLHLSLRNSTSVGTHVCTTDQ